MKKIMACMTIGLFSLPAMASDAYGDPFEDGVFEKMKKKHVIGCNKQLHKTLKKPVSL